DQSRAISCRGRATWPRRDLFQGQGLGCPHGQGRSPDHWSEPGLVRSGRQGPDRHSEGKIANERAAAKKHCYSITSSARATSLSGTVWPSAFAVSRLTTVSNLVGACSGRSAGFTPLRMRSIQRPMSALGQKRTLRRVCVMSALPSKADVRWLCLLGTFSRKKWSLRSRRARHNCDTRPDSKFLIIAV